MVNSTSVDASVTKLESEGYLVFTPAQSALVLSRLLAINNTTTSTNTTVNTMAPTVVSTNTTVNNIAVDAEYTEEHLHHKAHWYGKRAVQTATLWADGATLLPYVVTSGNNTWSTDNTDFALLFGTGDVLTELGAGILGGDFNEILVTANSSDTPYKLRILWGTGTTAEAEAANQYSETMYMKKSTDSIRIVRNFTTPVIPITMGGLPIKIWMSTWNASNDATLSFLIGVHGYDF
jgi:hypothetical protein